MKTFVYYPFNNFKYIVNKNTFNYFSDEADLKWNPLLLRPILTLYPDMKRQNFKLTIPYRESVKTKAITVEIQRKTAEIK